MADLIAQGPELAHRWRRCLPENQTVILGREAGIWSVPWDDRISREHARLVFNGSELAVQQIETARNPIFLAGHAAVNFQIALGQHFVIGSTSFMLASLQMRVAQDSPQPDREVAFNAAELRRLAFRNMNRLPEVIPGAASDTDLFARLVNLLMAAIPRADTVAIVEADSAAGTNPVRVVQWDRRQMSAGEFQPSQRLIQRAVARHESVLHTWNVAGAANEFTVTDSIDWAFCTPLAGEAKGWAFYVAGRFRTSAPQDAEFFDTEDLRDDVKFAELAAATLSSLRELRRLTRQQAGLSQFFSPRVMEAIARDDPEKILAPRETQITVMFCDLRGFSRTSERGAGKLFDLLTRVSQALGVMTHEILEHGGVIGDFQGDAAMGFWGWPLPEPNAAERAARAALAIRSAFEAAALEPENPMADFQVGIGLASGPAVAGKIGTTDHVKVTVFGPVVTLAARLESMTRLLGASILIDSATATILRGVLPARVVRMRRLAIVRPYGIDKAVDVHELLPAAAEQTGLTDAHLRDYEAALDEFVAGNWPVAIEMLQQLHGADSARDFLLDFMKSRGGMPPHDWDGVVPLSSK
jgi:adenylate cyclase